MEQALPFLYVLVGSLVGGFVEAATGFGFGICVMMFFPLCMTMLQASALSSMISLVLNLSLFFHYRKHAQWKKALLPIGVYIIVSMVIITVLPQVDMRALKLLFAVFMLVMACYLAFFSGKMHVRPTPLSTMACSVLGGASDGLFAMGGPPMIVYFMGLYGNDKLTYIATLQFFFAATCLVSTGTRLANGYYTGTVLLLLIPGLIGQAIGAKLGTKVVDRISIPVFKKVVYGCLALSGLITLITTL